MAVVKGWVVLEREIKKGVAGKWRIKGAWESKVTAMNWAERWESDQMKPVDAQYRIEPVTLEVEG